MGIWYQCQYPDCNILLSSYMLPLGETLKVHLISLYHFSKLRVNSVTSKVKS